MNDEHHERLEEQLTEAIGLVKDSLPEIDVDDRDQALARSAIGSCVGLLLEYFEQVAFASDPGPAGRVSLVYLQQCIQLLADVHYLTKPSERTFPHAGLVGHVLRTLVEIHARSLAIWTSSDPDATLRGLLSESLRTELLALEAAKAAGADPTNLQSQLEAIRSELGDPTRLNVVGILETNEQALESIYRWESGHLHLGSAALMASARAFTAAGAVVDVGMFPTSLWRLGQVTWAAYGVAMRAISHLSGRIRVDFDPVRQADAAFRPTVRAPALREFTPDEPPSPRYGAFALPLYES